MEGTVPMLDSEELSIAATGSRIPEPWRHEDIRRHMKVRKVTSEGVIRSVLSHLGVIEPIRWTDATVRKNGGGRYIVCGECLFLYGASERIPAAACRVMAFNHWRMPEAQFTLSALDNAEQDRILWMTSPACPLPEALLAWNECGIIEPPR